MVRFCMNEMTTYRWSFEEDVQHYSAAGIGGISVWRQKLSDYGEEKGIELLREFRLDVASVLWAGGFTGSDGRSYKESIVGRPRSDPCRCGSAGRLSRPVQRRSWRTHHQSRQAAVARGVERSAPDRR